MKRTRKIAAGLGVLMLSLLAVAGHVPVSTAQVGSTHIEVFAVEGPFEKDIDVATTGFPTAGDYAVESQPLLDPTDGSRVGRSLSHVQIVRPVSKGQDFEIVLNSTLRLSDGDIVIDGGLRFSDLFGGGTIAVVGGTGTYTGARGTATSTGGKVAGADGFTLSIDITTD
ncbi:MAG TPA: hypothetical protein VF984_00630 [Actinomycetota bacterium]